MNKSNKYIPWLIFVIILLTIPWIYIYWQSHSLNTNSPTNSNTGSSTAESTKNLPVEIKNYSYDLYPGEDKEVVLEYPEIKSGLLSAQMTGKINAEISSTTKTQFDSNVNDLKETISAETPEANAMELLEYNQVVIPEKVYLNTSANVFSYISYEQSYTGGAHGLHAYSSNVIDTKTGLKLEMNSFLNTDFDKVETAFLRNHLSNAILKNDGTCDGCDRLSDSDWWSTAEKITPDGYALTADGIIFLFNDYNLGSYVASGGGQLLFVPKADLAKYIIRPW